MVSRRMEFEIRVPCFTGVLLLPKPANCPPPLYIRLFYPSREYVDYVWGKLARSVIDGPLSKLEGAHVHTIKVATADDEDPLDQKKQDSFLGSTVVICLYFDNVWERSHAEKVLRCVLTEHGEFFDWSYFWVHRRFRLAKGFEISKFAKPPPLRAYSDRTSCRFDRNKFV